MLPGSSEHKDMAEIEEPLGTSPPLELRRSTSVPRPTIAVPHSLQSPQDRTAGNFASTVKTKQKMRYSNEVSSTQNLLLLFIDSPQVAQVYVHGTRIPHPHFPDARFYENPRATLQSTNEPPPAHRSVLPTTTPYGTASIPAPVRDRGQREREREREKERTSSIPGSNNILNFL